MPPFSSLCGKPRPDPSSGVKFRLFHDNCLIRGVIALRSPAFCTPGAVATERLSIWTWSRWGQRASSRSITRSPISPGSTNARPRGRAARVSGLSVDESARLPGLSPATIGRDWKFARAWQPTGRGRSATRSSVTRRSLSGRRAPRIGHHGRCHRRWDPPDSADRGAVLGISKPRVGRTLGPIGFRVKFGSRH
jgi:ECF sigma factor